MLSVPQKSPSKSEKDRERVVETGYCGGPPTVTLEVVRSCLRSFFLCQLPPRPPPNVLSLPTAEWPTGTSSSSRASFYQQQASDRLPALITPHQLDDAIRRSSSSSTPFDHPQQLPTPNRLSLTPPERTKALLEPSRSTNAPMPTYAPFIVVPPLTTCEKAVIVFVSPSWWDCSGILHGS